MSEEQKESLKSFIVSELKKDGLDILEESAMALLKSVLRIYPLVAAKTENKLDDMAVPVLELLRPQFEALIDKIDGEEG